MSMLFCIYVYWFLFVIYIICKSVYIQLIQFHNHKDNYNMIRMFYNHKAYISTRQLHPQENTMFDNTVYPKKYAHGFVVLCFVVVMQSFIMNSHEVFIHIHQGCFAGTGAIVRLPQCQWSKPDGYGKISQCITTTKHSKAKTCAYFLGYTVNSWVYFLAWYVFPVGGGQ